MPAVDDGAEQIGVENDEVWHRHSCLCLVLLRDLPMCDRPDIAVGQCVLPAERVLARVLRNEDRGKMASELFGQLGLAGRFRAGQADAERTSDFFHSIHPITARPRNEAYKAALA